MTVLEEEQEKIEVVDPDPFRDLSFLVTIPVAEVLGRSITEPFEAKVFQALVNQFYSSTILYDQLRIFVNTYFEQAKQDLKSEDTGLILPNRSGLV